VRGSDAVLTHRGPLTGPQDLLDLGGREPHISSKLGERQSPLQNPFAYPRLRHPQQLGQFANRQQLAIPSTGPIAAEPGPAITTGRHTRVRVDSHLFPQTAVCPNRCLLEAGSGQDRAASARPQ
jgi:hypothetical protein